MPALPASPEPPFNPRPWLETPRSVVPVVLAALGAAVALVSFGLERYEWFALVASLCAISGSLYIGGWWKDRTALSLSICVNVLLIFGYLWSLDEQIAVTVELHSNVYIARVGNDVARASVRPRTGRFGLTAGDLGAYRVQPTGEAPPPSNPSLLASFGNWMRLAEPRPAWTEVRLGSGSRLRNMSVNAGQNWQGKWTTNIRGEIEGSLGGALLFPSPQTAFSAKLLRPDGSQGVLAGIDSSGTGYLLQIRMDQPDAIWFQWRDGEVLQPVGGTPLHPDFVPMLQRDLRLLLGNVIAALILLLVAIPAYGLLLVLTRLLGFKDEDLRGLNRLIEHRKAATSIATAASIAAVLAAALIASKLLQEIPHVQDSVAYLFQAKTLALGRLEVPVPKLATFFREEFIPMYHGHWFGKYPPGWPLLLAVGVVVNLPWLVNPVLAGADILLIYLIGREVYPNSVALVATILALSSPFFLFLAGSFMAHTATLFYLGGFAYLLIRWVRRTEKRERTKPWRLLLPAGFLLAMALITRQLDALAFAAPFAGVLLFPAVRRQIAAFRWLFLGALTPLVFLLLYNWFLTGHALTSPYSIWSPADHPGFGKDVGWMGGFTPAQGLWNASYNLQMLLAHLFGWPFFLTLALACLPFLLGRANRWDVIFGASALSIIVAYIFYWGAGVMYGPRYYYVAIPWFALLTARGLQEFYMWLLRLPIRLPKDRMAATAVPVLLAAGLLAYDLSVYLPAQVPIYRGYNFTSAAALDTVKRAGLHHALVFVVSDPPGEWWSYGETFSANSPTLDTDVIYARDLGAADSKLMRLYPTRTYFRLKGTRLAKL